MVMVVLVVLMVLMVMVVLVVLMVLMVMVLLHTPECHLTDRWLGDEYCVVRTEKTHSPLSLSQVSSL